MAAIAKVQGSSFFQAHIRVINTLAIMAALSALVTLGIYLSPLAFAAGPVAHLILVYSGVLGVGTVGVTATLIIKNYLKELQEKNQFFNLYETELKKQIQLLEDAIENFYNKEIENIGQLIAHHKNIDKLIESLGTFEGFLTSFLKDKNKIIDEQQLKINRDRFEELKKMVSKSKEEN
ncbi:MAG: hypothetical protein HZB76_02190 [Chlamydiae bacterium]|nr:hypothetical protein [Chlamydiota bacterium]